MRSSYCHAQAWAGNKLVQLVRESSGLLLSPHNNVISMQVHQFWFKDFGLQRADHLPFLARDRPSAYGALAVVSSWSPSKGQVVMRYSPVGHYESQWWSRPRLCCLLNNTSVWDWGFTWGQACSTTAGELLQLLRLPPLKG